MCNIKNTIKKNCPKFLMSFYENHILYKNRIEKEKQYKTLLAETRLHYKKVETSIRNRGKNPLRFASYVVFDSSFGAYKLMEYMLENKTMYTSKIVIVPDISRGKQHMLEQYKNTRSFFIRKYGIDAVLDGYNYTTGEFIDLSSLFDVIYLANPYDSMVNKLHSIQYLSTKNVLPIYISYGCNVDLYSCNIVIPSIEISLFWKVFADNRITYNDYKKYELIHGENVVITGYAKMDDLAKYIKTETNKKIIIIAPHHTINMSSLPLSNFLDNYDFILELPQIYPQIQFIFRPHPLLITTMINEGYWTKEQADEFITKLKSLGVIYSYGGDYLKTFVESDAIIHDCSSFVVEYLYTGKPCCFFAKKNYKSVFSKLGKICLRYYYLAYNRKQICNFIDEIVLKENDFMANKRQKFVNKEISVNYPNVSRILLKEITIL